MQSLYLPRQGLCIAHARAGGRIRARARWAG